MGFGRIFFFIFAFALLEVLVLAKVAGLIGWPITIIATVVTALLGSYLFRRQGLETWVRLNQRMQQGDMRRTCGRHTADTQQTRHFGQNAKTYAGHMQSTHGVFWKNTQKTRGGNTRAASNTLLQNPTPNTKKWTYGCENTQTHSPQRAPPMDGSTVPCTS